MIPAQRSCRSDAPPSRFRHFRIWSSPSRSLDPVRVLGFRAIQEEPGEVPDLVFSRQQGLAAVIVVGSTARPPDCGEKLCDQFRHPAKNTPSTKIDVLKYTCWPIAPRILSHSKPMSMLTCTLPKVPAKIGRLTSTKSPIPSSLRSTVWLLPV